MLISTSNSDRIADLYIIQLAEKKTQMATQYLKKPVFTKKTSSMKGYGFYAATCQMQGWRKAMEDALLFTEIADQIYLFAVCDGHGGPQVSRFVGENLAKTLSNDQDFKNRNYPKALANTFKKLDELIASQRGEELLRSLNKSLGGRPLDEDDKIGYRAGTTLILLLLTKDKYYVANAGDSRAILSRNGQAVALSYDHKPELPQEKERIEKAGGYVHNGRVNGTLSLSRSLGDFELKHFSNRPYEQQAVSSVPEIIQLFRKKQDNFVFIACDGVWEKYAKFNQKMVDHLKRLRARYNDKEELLSTLLDDLVAKQTKEALGCDNMSGIFIEFI